MNKGRDAGHSHGRRAVHGDVVERARIAGRVAARVVDRRPTDGEEIRPVTALVAVGQVHWILHLARGQRCPRDLAVLLAEPDHRRTPVLMRRAGNPGPAVRRGDPRSIMVRHPAPRFVGHPGPPERLDPDPAPVLIRTPARVGLARAPHFPVLRIIMPGAVGVQIARHHRQVRRQVRRALGIGKLPVAVVIEPVPAVFVRQQTDLHWGRGIGNIEVFAAAEGDLRAAAFHGRLTQAHGDFDAAVHADPYLCRPFGVDRHKRRIYLVEGGRAAQLQRRQPFRQLQLGKLAGVVTGQRLERHNRAAAEPEQAAVIKLHFRPPAVRHPDLRPLPERQVHRRRGPRRAVSGSPGHSALHKREPGQANWPRRPVGLRTRCRTRRVFPNLIPRRRCRPWQEHQRRQCPRFQQKTVHLACLSRQIPILDKQTQASARKFRRWRGKRLGRA